MPSEHSHGHSNKEASSPNSHAHSHGSAEKSLKMEDDLDVIKIGAWMNSKQQFENKGKLFVYWLFLCMASTVI